MLTLLFSHAKSTGVNSFAHIHLPFLHIPELSLPVHCLLKLQNPPTGTVSEIIKNDDLRIGKTKVNKSVNFFLNTAKHKNL